MLIAAVLAASVVGIASSGACTRDATVTSMVTPDFPHSALQTASLPATVSVIVSLDASGRVVRESVMHSSGVRALDDSALRAAADSKYSPRILHCKPTPGNYLFKVTFSG